MTTRSNLQRIVDFNKRGGRKTDEPSTSAGFQGCLELIAEEYQEVFDAVNGEGDDEVAKELADLIVVAAGALYKLGYSPDDVLDKVNTANESKFAYTKEDAEASVALYAGSDRYEDVHYVEDEGVYVIWGYPIDTTNKKILKGVNFQPAVIE